MLRVSDCVTDRVRLAIPQPPERQHIADKIDAAMIFARTGLRKCALACIAWLGVLCVLPNILNIPISFPVYADLNGYRSDILACDNDGKSVSSLLSQ